METIDLNCDLGEGASFDAELMPLISSCNIACGGHFGTKESVEKTVDLAVKNDVNIGAHPSYPDKENFGRKPMNIRLTDLKQSLKEQLNLIKRITERVGVKLHHVKPHGFLYNQIVYDAKKANLVIEAVREVEDSLILFVPPQSIVAELAKGKLETWQEGFADRNYNPDYTLVSRQKDNAVLIDKEQVFNRFFSVVKRQEIEAVNGEILPVNFDTICLHSDTKNSIEIAQYLVNNLPKKGIDIL